MTPINKIHDYKIQIANYYWYLNTEFQKPKKYHPVLFVFNKQILIGYHYIDKNNFPKWALSVSYTITDNGISLLKNQVISDFEVSYWAEIPARPH